MKRFVEGEGRRQGVLLPEFLDDVSEENPVRVIEAFVEALDLENALSCPRGVASLAEVKHVRVRRPTTGRRPSRSSHDVMRDSLHHVVRGWLADVGESAAPSAGTKAPSEVAGPSLPGISHVFLIT
jgi:hypothetical protein